MYIYIYIYIHTYNIVLLAKVSTEKSSDGSPAPREQRQVRIHYHVRIYLSGYYCNGYLIRYLFVIIIIIIIIIVVVNIISIVIIIIIIIVDIIIIMFARLRVWMYGECPEHPGIPPLETESPTKIAVLSRAARPFQIFGIKTTRTTLKTTQIRTTNITGIQNNNKQEQQLNVNDKLTKHNNIWSRWVFIKGGVQSEGGAVDAGSIIS